MNSDVHLMLSRMIRRALVVLAWIGGITVRLIVLFIAGALFVALVNSTTNSPEEPPDTGLTPEQVGEEIGRPVLEEESRQRCEEAREEIPDLSC
jgi:hypothetical protein